MKPGTIVILLPSRDREASVGMVLREKKLELTTFYDVFIPSVGAAHTLHQMYVQKIDD